MSDPLFDTLFRPTALSPVVASAPPVRAKGVHTRAGNAMTRTRAALLTGAARAVEVSGTRITMAQVAAAAGVAKATLYNHFRTREAVLAALVAHQIEAIIDAQAGKPVAAALADAAVAIGSNPVRRGLARVEPAVLVALGRVDPSATGWQRARAAVEAALAGESRDGVDTVLRWLASFLITEGDRAAIARDVEVLIAGLSSPSVSAAAV